MLLREVRIEDYATCDEGDDNAQVPTNLIEWRPFSWSEGKLERDQLCWMTGRIKVLMNSALRVRRYRRIIRAHGVVTKFQKALVPER